MSFIESWGQTIYNPTETVWGKAAQPTAATGAQVLEVEFTGDRAKTWREDTQQSRSRFTRVVGRHEAGYRVRGYLLPSGPPKGTSPDLDGLLHTMFSNKHGGVASSSVLYEPANVYSTAATLWRVNNDETDIYIAEAAAGCIGQRMEVRFGGGNFAEIELAGVARRLVHAVNGTLATAAAASTLTITTNDAYRYSRGAYVYFVGATGGTTYYRGGNPFMVTTVPHSTTLDNRITLESKTLHTVANGAYIRPHMPTPTTAGIPLDSSQGTLQVGTTSQTVSFVGGTITVEEGRDAVNDEYGYKEATNVQESDWRNVTFDLEGYIEDERMLSNMGRSSEKTESYRNQNVEVQMGDTSGYRMRVIMPYAELDRPSCEFPLSAPGRLRIAGVAKASSGSDEIRIKFW